MVKPSSVGDAEVKLLPVERRAGDPSAVAGAASILASFSSLRQDLSRLRPTAQTGSKAYHGTELPSPIVHEDELDGLEVNSATNGGSDSAADVGATSKILPIDSNLDSVLEAGNVKLSGRNNNLLRPLLRMLDSSTCNLELSKNFYKQVLEEREWTRESLPPSTSGMSLRCAVFREDIHYGILDGRDIKVSFDDFPYYLRYGTFK